MVCLETDGIVGFSNGKREDQPPAAHDTGGEGEQIAAKLVGQHTCLHMRPSHMYHINSPLSVKKKGVDFPKQRFKGLAAFGKIDPVMIDPNKIERRNRSFKGM